ncbi:YdaU family protein [Allorhizobium sp. BGMRC 0089]|uniref:YdaU family protein n=1 Tax=Allorhizobium sonneratiae TaxID=2934936 RepID=UPI0020336395|nr:DUF1376 domain-containing protein [Allorhizobium sonneratiae]MCM2293053.1 YdaU family protein [Allorhizobium sonneratiae]
MSNRAWMPLHIADYLADTGHLTATEHGAYLLLIMHYWQHGHLPENERVIARIAKLTPDQWDESRDILAMLFGPCWTHKRIDAELAKADEIIEKRRAAAEARHSKEKKHTSDAHALHMHSKCSDTRVPPIPDNQDTSSLRSDVCPEPQAAPVSPTVIELPATQNQIVGITEADVAEWADAFPAVDVPQKLKSIRQWLIANPQKRKTARGMRRFVVSWLTREQDKGGGGKTGPPVRQESDFARHQRECTEALERKVYGDRRHDQFASNSPAYDLEPGDWRPH